jgi:hypothetical protein
MVEEDLAFLATHYRLLRTWETVRPCAIAERRLRGDPYSYLNFFEDLALMTSTKSSPNVGNTDPAGLFGSVHENGSRLSTASGVTA